MNALKNLRVRWRMLFKDKVVIVTGAARGIGRAIALKMAREGACVVITYVNREDMANTALKEIELFGGNAIAIKADVCEKSHIKNMIDITLSKFGHIDMLINNAGINVDNFLISSNSDNLTKMVSTNIMGTILCSKAVVKHMRKRHSGIIINISSSSGIHCKIKQATYSATKAAIIAFTSSLGSELGRYGIRVNAVAPGYIETDMTSVFTESERLQHIESISLGRPGSSDEIAEVVAFLASSASSYINCQTIVVDGGKS